MSKKNRDPAISNCTAGTAKGITEIRCQEVLLNAEALQNAIFNSAMFSKIATDAKGVIQIFNVGAERMLGYTAADVMNKITPADISDPQELIVRAKALSAELGTPITPGFEALVFKASRGIEDIYELTYIRKDDSRFPAVVSVTALRDAQNTIIGYLLISTDNTARKQVEAERQRSLEVQEETHQQLQRNNLTLQISEEQLAVTLNSIGDAVIATDVQARVILLNPIAERLTGWTHALAVGRPIDEVFHIINKETRQLSTIPVLETLAHGTLHGLANHTVLIARDGSEYDIADSCAPIRDRNDRVIGAVLVFRDVSKEYALQHTLSKQREELEKQNEKLRENEERFRTLADNISQLAWMGDAQGSLFWYNQRWFDYTGTTLEEMHGWGWQKVHHPDHEQRVVEKFKHCLETGAVWEDTFPLRGADGQYRWFLSRALPIRDEHGMVFRWFGTNTDITERKEAGALQNAIFDSANFSSIATDAKGVIQIFNVGAERMLGYTAADVMNKITPADISDPQELIVRAKALSAELGTPITPGFEALVFKASRGIEDIYELTYIRKDDSRFPAVVSVTALRDAQNTIIGYLLIGTDNSARKQIEEKQKKLDQRLRDQQFYTRSLIESNIDALMTTDPSGIITDVNKQMEALTGCTRDELIGAPFKNYFTDPELAEAGIKLVLSEKKVIDYELTALARDGKETAVSYNATTFYDRDRVLQGVFAAARDVTERNRLDQVLREQNIELENARAVADKANLAKSDFLSSMSHELRSPLNAILGFAQLMESDSTSITPSQKNSLTYILQAGWHLLTLINEILDLAMVESGKVPMSQEPVELDKVMLGCRNMIESQAEQRGIKLSFPQFDTPLYVRADRTRLKQILINLLSNAIKYNSKQGKVEVTCIENRPGRVRISIEDSGAGLDPEQIAQLFQPFNRLGQDSGSEEGTGIGLVLSKQLVEVMGGKIGVRSTVGVGSVFWFELNSAAEPRLSMEEDETTALFQMPVLNGAQPHSVLYVEDNPANMQLIKDIISRYPDIQLLTAVNGYDGIEIARTSQPSVIMMDINLPGISGLEVLKILREDPTTAHIPVIAVSANALPLDIEKGLKAGLFLYITKPVKVKELMEAVNMALEFAERKIGQRQLDGRINPQI